MNLIKRTLVAAAFCCGVVTNAFAQHYPAGAEGIRTASLPPNGVYLRDYNFFYFAPEPNVPGLLDVFAYVNAPRVIWMTDQKILGADYGMDLIVPFGYTSVKYLRPGPGPLPTAFVPATDSRFGLADIQIEPVLLSWHPKQFDVSLAYAIWAPTGEFDRNRVANLGKGFWTHMFTAGATWYMDEKKTWALGLLNRYEINHEQEDTNLTPGHTLTSEWGLSKTVCKNVDVGFVGYWQQQITKNSIGSHETGSLSHVVGVGPEISAACSQLGGLITSVRYLREIEAKDRPQGNTLTLTLTKRF